MSRFAAIDVAVRMQLASDLRRIDYHLTMATMVRAADGVADPYDPAAMKTFLLNVANRLRLDDPPRALAWDALDVEICRTCSIPMLISLIESKMERPPPRPPAPPAQVGGTPAAP